MSKKIGLLLVVATNNLTNTGILNAENADKFIDNEERTVICKLEDTETTVPAWNNKAANATLEFANLADSFAKYLPVGTKVAISIEIQPSEADAAEFRFININEELDKNEDQ